MIAKGIDPAAEVERQRVDEARKRANTVSEVCADYLAWIQGEKYRSAKAMEYEIASLVKIWGERR